MEIQLNRIILLVKRQILKDGKRYFIALSAGLVIAIIIAALSMVSNSSLDPQIYSTLSAILLILGGSILSASMFSELDKQDSGYQLMALPVSTLEKLISFWLISFVLFLLAATAFIYLGAGILTMSATMADFTIQGSILNAFPVWDLVLAYSMSNAIYLLGGATFKNWAFIKTAFASGIVSLVVSGILVIIAWITFKSVIGTSQKITNGNMVISNNSTNLETYFNSNSELLGWTISITFLIFCWTVTYFKLKEREI